MQLQPVLLLLSLPGCVSIQGPESVRGLEGGSVTVQCHYTPGWETYKKWWCRGAYWKSCDILVQTEGSEQEVKRDHVSIRDNQRQHLLTVTMKEVRQSDTDTYWCGISKPGPDLGAPIKVTIDPEEENSPEREKPGHCIQRRSFPVQGQGSSPGGLAGHREPHMSPCLSP
ncbi:CMRF35-like molecule 7 isoform X2 [Canis lupus baileyi]|uniref:CMRF35-like molecule 7 isoform X2 n=1 Tax=Canis lupus familiaris TaxID=9615 RepID=UPI0015F1BB0E|nr:CMRF35-like molecule 7 isoform X2 [Canis lupus familiaris]XP_038482137.1 CMRF35-like molecule 7 isoform X2 [Canis lupus familiaris]XP_038531729.1 CMRF35-like molecule 7 isoform X2 [Canis lupus familiaris]